MNPKVTKILIGIVLVLILFALVYGIYNYSVAPDGEIPISEEETYRFPESRPVSSGNETSEAIGEEKIFERNEEFVPSSKTDNGIAEIKVISEKPTAGATFVEKIGPNSKEKKLFVRYMEKETGHAYEIAFNENSPKKVSNTTITRIYDVLWNNLAESAILRRLDEKNAPEIIYASVEETRQSTSTSAFLNGVQSGKLITTLISSSIDSIAVSPDKKRFFSLTEINNGNVGTTEDFVKKLGTNKKQIFNSPLKEWLAEWPEKNTISLTTKPSADVPGYLYFLGTNNLKLTKVLGEIKGLTAKVSPNLKYILYSDGNQRNISTWSYNISNKTRAPLSLKTLPEKCTFSKLNQTSVICGVPLVITAGSYPDDWYQGEISFEDELWKIDLSNGNTINLVDKSLLRRSGGVDATNLELSPDEKYLIFTNKKDSSLWLAKIE